MIALGLKPFPERRYFGDNRSTPDIGCPLARRREMLPLRFIRIKHGRAILRTRIRTLAVELAGIMKGKEDVEDDGLRNDGLVEGDGNRLGVAGAARADRLVVRGGRLSPGVAGNDCGYTLKNAVNSIQAPETTAGENESLHREILYFL